MKNNLKTQLCNKLIDENKVQEGDVIRHSYSTNRLENGDRNMGRLENHEGLSPTLDTRCDCLGVVVKEKYSDESIKRIKKNVVEEDVAPTITANAMQSVNHQNCALIKVGNYGNGHHTKDVYDVNGLSPTITTGNHGLGQTIAIKNATKQGYLEASDGDGIDISGRMEHHRVTVQKGISQTLNTMGGNDVGVIVEDDFTDVEKQLFTKDGNIRRYIGSDKVDVFKDGQMATTTYPNGYGHGPRTHNESIALNTIDRPCVKQELRIRKLTPKECCRLMGFEDQDYESMKKIGMSDAAIYHCCGDSIVVPVLISIFSTMFEKENYRDVVNEYTKGIIGK